MKYLTGNEIRDIWLKFFEDKGHNIEESASLIPNNDKTLLTVGRLVKRKGQALVIEAIKDLDCKYFIVGRGSEKNNLLELIKDVDPNKNVVYNYSPKIFNDTEWDDAVKLAEQLVKFENVFIKLVVYKKDKFGIDYLEHISEFFPNNRIYLMPLGKDKKEMFENAPFMFDKAEKYKTNVSSRMHLVYDFI